jgi:type III secretion protein C
LHRALRFGTMKCMKIKFQSGLQRIITCAVLCASCIADWAAAAPIPWAEQDVRITIKEQRLKDVLKGIFESNLLPVQIDPGVDGTVKDVRYNLKPQQLVDLLARQYSFSVYFDGQTVFVTPSAANVNRVFKLDKNAQAQARRILTSLNLVDPRFPIRFDEAGRIASVVGPARYVSAVEAALLTLEDSSSSTQRGEVRIFPLANGIAADRSVLIGANELTISGVASLLRKIYKPQANSDRIDASRTNRPQQVRKGGIDPMNAVLRSLGGKDGTPDSTANNDSSTTVTVIESRESSELPIIEAVPQINAVAIRDTPERLRMYEDVVKRLDIKPSVVLAEVSIVEISSDLMDRVGVDWRIGNARGGLSTGSNQSPNAGSPIPIDGRGVIPSAPGALAFLSGIGRSSLVQAQIYAMIENGSAKVVSTPRIVTMLNEEGLFSNNSTFYARVAGNLEANLFAIESGTSIRITPLSVINEGDLRSMRFAVRIEDGRFSDRTVDNLPVTQKSTILTSAIVPVGQSLALAGVTEESSSNGIRGVPVLSNLPGIGALFRTKTEERRSVQRVYLITPRIIE